MQGIEHEYKIPPSQFLQDHWKFHPKRPATRKIRTNPYFARNSEAKTGQLSCVFREIPGNSGIFRDIPAPAKSPKFRPPVAPA